MMGVALAGVMIAFIYAQFINFIGGIPEIRVPQVVGMAEEDAVAVLKEYKLDPHLIGKRYSETVSVNNIIRMTPEPGSKVKVGRRVSYLVSMGSEDNEMPSFLGKTLEEAMELLKEKPFQIENAGELYSSRFRTGTIVSQDPAVAQSAPETTVIRFWLSKGYPVSITSTRIESAQNRYQVKIDLQVMDQDPKTDVRILSILNGEHRVLYHETVLPGKELFFEIEQVAGAKIEVYYNDELAIAKDVI